MATFQQETEETGSGVDQLGLTGKAMRMRTEKTKRLKEMEKAGENVAGRFVEGKFDEEQMDTDVKQEPVGNLVLEGVSLLEFRSFLVQKLTLFLSGGFGEDKKTGGWRTLRIPRVHEAGVGSDLPLLSTRSKEEIVQ